MMPIPRKQPQQALVSASGHSSNPTACSQLNQPPGSALSCLTSLCPAVARHDLEASREERPGPAHTCVSGFQKWPLLGESWAVQQLPAPPHPDTHPPALLGTQRPGRGAKGPGPGIRHSPERQPGQSTGQSWRISGQTDGTFCLHTMTSPPPCAGKCCLAQMSHTSEGQGPARGDLVGLQECQSLPSVPVPLHSLHQTVLLAQSQVPEALARPLPASTPGHRQLRGLECPSRLSRSRLTPAPWKAWRRVTSSMRPLQLPHNSLLHLTPTVRLLGAWPCARPLSFPNLIKPE